MTCDWKNRIAVSVLDGFKRKYDGQSFTDIQIDITGTVFHCHKVFLCSISDYFHAMFTSGMRECLVGKVALEGISVHTFQNIICFYYEGKGDVVHIDNVEEMLRASTLLQMDCLQQKCEEFYMEHLCVENAIGIWQLAMCLNCELLKTKSMSYILDNFVNISCHEEFLSIESCDLLDILSKDDLKVPDEDLVCNVAILWIKYDCKRRIAYLQDICRTIRSSLLSDVCLHKLLTIADCIESDLDSSSIGDIKAYTDLSTSKKPRNYEEVLMTIGVRVSAGLLPSLNAYSFVDRKWYSMEALPLDPGVGFAVCAHNNDIYISGRYGRKTYLLQYNSSVDEWLHCPEMLDNRYYHEMIATDNSLYVIGGCNRHKGALTSVDMYDISEQTWHHFSHLLFGVYSTSCAIVGNSLFVFGGRGMGSRRTHEVQSMNLANGTTTVVHLFHSPITESRALSVGDEAYIFATNGSIVKIFEDGAVFPVAHISNFDRYNFGVFLHKGLLVVAGGETRYPSGPGFNDMIQIIINDSNKLSKETVLMTDVLYPYVSAFGCQKIILHRSLLKRLSDEGTEEQESDNV